MLSGLVMRTKGTLATCDNKKTKEAKNVVIRDPQHQLGTKGQHGSWTRLKGQKAKTGSKCAQRLRTAWTGSGTE